MLLIGNKTNKNDSTIEFLSKFLMKRILNQYQDFIDNLYRWFYINRMDFHDAISKFGLIHETIPTSN